MKNPLSSPLLLAASLAALLAAGCVQPVPPPAAPPRPMDAAAYEALGSYSYSGGQDVLARLDREIASAGTDPARVSPIVSGLLATVAQPGATFAARQAACQRLGQLLAFDEPGPAALAVLEPLLSDDALADLGRLALEPVPGPRVDQAFMRALRTSKGPTRLALVQSLGNRHAADAVQDLAPLTADPDPATRRAAAAALGRIATPSARVALESASDRDRPTFVDARLACLERDPGAEAPGLLRAILDDPDVVAGQRSAAWRLLLGREPSAALERITFALQTSDPERRHAALAAARETRDPGLVRALSQALPALDAQTQQGVLEVLGARGDPRAAPAALSLLQASNPEVRLAAIDCLGRLPGNRETCLGLARVASSEPSDETRAAKHSLARLSGAEVDAAVIAGFSDHSAALRAVFLEAAGLRDMTEAAPLLLKARQDPDARVRSAALESAGIVCVPGDQPALLAWCLAATDPTEVSRALKALAAVTLRNHDPASREVAILAAVDRGAKAERLRLVHVLPRLGDTPALECASRMALDGDPDQALAALSVLTNWPDPGALEALVQAAERTRLDPARDAAIQGAMRTVERKRTVPSAEPSGSIVRLIAAARTTEVRRRLVYLLSRGSSDAALAEARQLTSDPELARDAKDAEASILANKAWPPRVTSAYASSQVGAIVDGDPNTGWHAPVETGMSLQIDYGRQRPFRRIVIDSGPWEGGYPERYEIYVTDDPSVPGRPRAAGEGQTRKTVADLPAGVSGRYLIVKDVGTRASGEWAIYELQVD